MTAPQRVTDQTQWTVSSGSDVTEVTSHAGAWSEAIAAYTPGHPVLVRSRRLTAAPANVRPGPRGRRR
jgi:hypothetical protein